MKEWSHLNKIISSDPIDYSQIDFYLLLSNKNSSNSSDTMNKGSKNTIGSSNKIIIDDSNKFRYNEVLPNMDKNTF